MQTHEILRYFDNVSGECGSYMATCPCHNDRSPSLSITAKDGITLIHCFAGCEAKDIVKAVGLTFDDLRDSTNMSWREHCREYG